MAEQHNVSRYPSGAPMPQYGPSNDTEFITDALEWAVAVLIARDEMNAAIHCTKVHYSPVTTKVNMALGLWRNTIVDTERALRMKGEPEDAASEVDVAG